MLNSRMLARYFRLAGEEVIIEFNITNNSVVARIHDERKARQLRQGKGSLKKAGRLPAYQRQNTVMLATILNVINSDNNMKQKVGFGPDEVIQTMLMHGRNVTIRGYNRIEMEQDQTRRAQREQQSNPNMRTR